MRSGSEAHRINERISRESKMDNGTFPLQNLVKLDVHRKPQKEKWLHGGFTMIAATPTNAFEESANSRFFS